jgi:hypothetical protein
MHQGFHTDLLTCRIIKIKPKGIDDDPVRNNPVILALYNAPLRVKIDTDQPGVACFVMRPYLVREQAVPDTSVPINHAILRPGLIRVIEFRQATCLKGIGLASAQETANSYDNLA